MTTSRTSQTFLSVESVHDTKQILFLQLFICFIIGTQSDNFLYRCSVHIPLTLSLWRCRTLLLRSWPQFKLTQTGTDPDSDPWPLNSWPGEGQHQAQVLSEQEDSNYKSVSRLTQLIACYKFSYANISNDNNIIMNINKTSKQTNKTKKKNFKWQETTY